MKKIADIILVLVLAASAVLLVGWGCERRGYRRGVESAEARVERDTVVFRDTVRVDAPVPVESSIIGVMSVAVPADTERHTDTTLVELPVERKVYADSLFRVVVSGVNPSLDSIEMYRGTVVVTERIPVPVSVRRNSVGAGVGLILDGRLLPALELTYDRRLSYGFHIGGKVNYCPATGGVSAGVMFGWSVEF